MMALIRWYCAESLSAAVQEAVLSAGCIPALIKLASSANDELRLNAVWALQNLVYQASTDVRKALLDALSWRHAIELLSDMRSEVQVSANHAAIPTKKLEAFGLPSESCGSECGDP